ncbi:MAG: outer membrane lipoprotein chaperone LolA [Pseudomonadales bacterium]|nr:outer membrane lipoprotein chaperone LolA [Pseudomonadales bacterium]
MRHRSSFALFLLLAGLSGFLYADDAPVRPVADLEARLEGVRSLEAAFEQVTTDKDGRAVQQSEGHLWVQTPSLFRIETSTPFVQTLVSDGKSFWAYDQDIDQVVIRNLDEDVEQVPILLLGGASQRIEDEYDVSHFADEDIEHFVLVPKSPSSLFESLTLDFTGARPVGLSISDSLGQRTHITLKDVVTNVKIDDARFGFEAPQGVDVIDDRIDQ